MLVDTELPLQSIHHLAHIDTVVEVNEIDMNGVEVIGMEDTGVIEIGAQDDTEALLGAGHHQDTEGVPAEV